MTAIDKTGFIVGRRSSTNRFFARLEDSHGDEVVTIEGLANHEEADLAGKALLMGYRARMVKENDRRE